MKKQIVLVCSIISIVTYVFFVYGSSKKEIQIKSKNVEEQEVYKAIIQDSVFYQHEHTIVYKNSTRVEKIILDKNKLNWRNKTLYAIQKNVLKEKGDLLIQSIPDLKWDLPTLLPETVEDFNKVNQQPHPFNIPFDDPTKCLMLESEDFEKITKNRSEGWKHLHKKFPNSSVIIELSKVGFNSTMDQALVEISYYFELEGSYGIFSIWARENNSWVMKYERNAWRIDK